MLISGHQKNYLQCPLLLKADIFEYIELSDAASTQTELLAQRSSAIRSADRAG